LNSANHGILVEPQTVIDPKLVKDLKTVYSEAFEKLFFNDAKEVATAFKNKIKQMHRGGNYWFESQFLLKLARI
jgi:hypothetical protein